MSQLVQFLQATLTSAQILSMGSNPNTVVSVVPAAGSNLAINPIWVAAQYNSGSAAYVDVNGDANLQLSMGTSPNVTYSIPVTGFFDASGGTNTKKMSWLLSQEQFELPVSDIGNQPLVANISDSVTTGNGTITLSIYYVLVPLV